MAKKSKNFIRKQNKQYTMRFMKSYVSKNLRKGITKLNYLKKSKGYMASQEAQTANSMLRMLNRKYGFEEETMHYSTKFINSVTSVADMGVLFRTVNDLMLLDSRQLKKDFEEISKEFDDLGNIKFEDAFDILSNLSSEFHEIFAFITYDNAQAQLKSGDASNILNLLAEYEHISENKYIDFTDRQLRYKEIMDRKKSRLDSETLLSIQTIKNQKWGY